MQPVTIHKGNLLTTFLCVTNSIIWWINRFNKTNVIIFENLVIIFIHLKIFTYIYIYIYLTADTHKYFSVLYSPIKNHNCLLLSFSDRTLAASGAFWLKPTIYSADLISSGSNKIVVRGFSDDCCYSTTYPGHIVTLWTFWECFVDLPLVVVDAVTIDWQVAQLWLRHKNGGDKTLWRHVEPMKKQFPAEVFVNKSSLLIPVFGED